MKKIIIAYITKVKEQPTIGEGTEHCYRGDFQKFVTYIFSVVDIRLHIKIIIALVESGRFKIAFDEIGVER